MYRGGPSANKSLAKKKIEFEQERVRKRERAPAGAAREDTICSRKQDLQQGKRLAASSQDEGQRRGGLDISPVRFANLPHGSCGIAREGKRATSPTPGEGSRRGSSDLPSRLQRHSGRDESGEPKACDVRSREEDR